MNMFIHGEFYEGNAGCMQGVDAVVHGVDAENEHVFCNGRVHI